MELLRTHSANPLLLPPFANPSDQDDQAPDSTPASSISQRAFPLNPSFVLAIPISIPTRTPTPRPPTPPALPPPLAPLLPLRRRRSHERVVHTDSLLQQLRPINTLNGSLSLLLGRKLNQRVAL